MARPVPPGRFRRRLTVAFVLVAALAAAALATGSYLMVRQARYADSLDRAAADARYQLILAGQFLPLDTERSAGLLASFESSGRHVLLTVEGATQASNARFQPAPGEGLRAAAARGDIGYERTGGLLVVGGRIPGSTAELYLVHAEQQIDRDLRQLRSALLAGTGVVVLLAAGVGHLLARRTLGPVAQAAQAARAVAEGLLSTRLPVRKRDEFGDWAASFNEMAQALQTKIDELSAAQQRERRFTADVAHELRTPVTALVGAAGLLGERLDELPPDLARLSGMLVADSMRLRHLVEELMEISRLEAGREPVEPQLTDLTAAVHGIVAMRGWGGRVTVVGHPARAVTDPRRLDRVLANVIANAVEHTTGPVTVTVKPSTVSIVDTGPGIAAEHLPHLFDRFYKADRARSGPGSGLGLSIAAENAALIGAQLTVTSGPDSGTEVLVELP